MLYDLIIIGSGPGGYVAAIRASQLGMKTALIEKDKIGGMCLNWGCIPFKSILESAKKLETVQHAAQFGIEGIDPQKLSLNWDKTRKRTERIVQRLTKGVEFLLKKNQVEIITGNAEIPAPHKVQVNQRLLECRHILVATGSRPEKMTAPISLERILELSDFLSLPNLPEKPVVYGSGAPALELVQFFYLSGKSVTWVVPQAQPLPLADAYLNQFSLQLLKKASVPVFLSAEIQGEREGKLLVSDQEIEYDRLINAGPRRAILPAADFEWPNENRFLPVDNYLQTAIPEIYAVGDVNGRSSFAHAASAQGLQAVNVISGVREEMEFGRFPINIYTHPEMAQIGLTQDQAQEKKLDFKLSEFSLIANGKALIEGDHEGIIRIISEKTYGEVLGVQIIAPHATDLIAEAGLLMQMEGTVQELAHTIHAHPTISEIYAEAGVSALDQPIHK